jgi:hypothetical protein
MNDLFIGVMIFVLLFLLVFTFICAVQESWNSMFNQDVPSERYHLRKRRKTVDK